MVSGVVCGAATRRLTKSDRVPGVGGPEVEHERCQAAVADMTPRFEWDSRKAASNLQRHGASFGEATGVFCDPFARIFDDEDHSIEYPMMISRCSSKRNRLLLVSFTERESAYELSAHARRPGMSG